MVQKEEGKNQLTMSTQQWCNKAMEKMKMRRRLSDLTSRKHKLLVQWNCEWRWRRRRQWC